MIGFILGEAELGAKVLVLGLFALSSISTVEEFITLPARYLLAKVTSISVLHDIF